MINTCHLDAYTSVSLSHVLKMCMCVCVSALMGDVLSHILPHFILLVILCNHDNTNAWGSLYYLAWRLADCAAVLVDPRSLSLGMTGIWTVNLEVLTQSRRSRIRRFVLRLTRLSLSGLASVHESNLDRKAVFKSAIVRTFQFSQLGTCSRLLQSVSPLEAHFG